MDNAWMIRKDGKKFPVQVHIYGDEPGSGFDIYVCLSVCEWLYKATMHQETKNNIITLLAMWGYLINPEKDPVDNIIRKVEKQPYKSMSPEFLNQVRDTINARVDEMSDDDISKKEIKRLGLLLYKELNQEFLRARYGGMYDTSAGSREMYFRVSSVGFNWFNIIWEMVYDMQKRIDTVTIVRDEESTGASNFYYKSNEGDEYKQMDVNQFLTGRGNPVVESVTRYPQPFSRINPAGKMMQYLAEGYSISHILDNLSMNSQRAMSLYEHLNTWENEGDESIF